MQVDAQYSMALGLKINLNRWYDFPAGTSHNTLAHILLRMFLLFTLCETCLPDHFLGLSVAL